MISACCRKRSRIAVAEGTSPSNNPHSSIGRLEVIRVERFWWRRTTSSRRISALLGGKCFMPPRTARGYDDPASGRCDPPNQFLITRQRDWEGHEQAQRVP